ncbi:RF-1 domain-containing protein [Amycolatopsis arida]|uniref:RF-1 domain-containing protein n=2 Tax=Amycolatopsis arida TaxID=587909 RepID=A0A1I5SZK3_9PSEU|nr:RF-1 domain-containing protein [Amycolatopsis arida]SFP75646.1 RF-1 domain-containing protein [Amycolatopsis arida]
MIGGDQRYARPGRELDVERVDQAKVGPSRPGAGHQLDDGCRVSGMATSHPHMTHTTRFRCCRDRRGQWGLMDGVRVSSRVVIPAGELRERFSRSSGPGGQGVNTTDSRVELSFDVAGSPSLPEELRERVLRRLSGRLVDGVLTVVASEHRAQLANREAARERLAAVLRTAMAPPPPKRRPTKPSRGAKERRLAAKKHRSEVKRARRRLED